MSDKDKNNKPWGFFVNIYGEDGFIVKKIVVNPGHRLSLQKHVHRSEHWFVICGTGKLQLENRKIELETGNAIDIPRNAWHRIKNTGEIDLVFIEIQQGAPLIEEDIERKEDDYGRAD